VGHKVGDALEHTPGLENKGWEGDAMEVASLGKLGDEVEEDASVTLVDDLSVVALGCGVVICDGIDHVGYVGCGDEFGWTDGGVEEKKGKEKEKGGGEKKKKKKSQRIKKMARWRGLGERRRVSRDTRRKQTLSETNFQ